MPERRFLTVVVDWHFYRTSLHLWCGLSFIVPGMVDLKVVQN